MAQAPIPNLNKIIIIIIFNYKYFINKVKKKKFFKCNQIKTKFQKKNSKIQKKQKFSKKKIFQKKNIFKSLTIKNKNNSFSLNNILKKFIFN